MKGEVKKYQIYRVCNCGRVINGRMDGGLWSINERVRLLYICPYCKTSLIHNFVSDKEAGTICE